MGMTSEVTEADIVGSNGVIHIVDAVLLPGGDVVDIVSNTDSLSTLAGALTDAGLISTLQGDGPFTVFAPTNDAITAFTGVIDTELLLYHVLGAEYLSANIPTGETNLATANTDGDQVTVIKNDTGVFVEDILGRIGQVTMANIAGTNGVVHIIDIVLANRESPTIVDLAAADSRLTTLVQALTDADGDLLSVLSGSGPFTVFAPTNDAFAAITVPTDTAVLSNVLQYHVLSGEVLSSALSSGLVADTIISQTITCQIDNGVFFYDSMGRASEVIEADIQATNGVIHIVDAVFLPDGTIADITSNIASLSTLNGALAANSLDTVLSGSGPFTVFAPTNDAVAAFGGSITSEVLLYHVLGAEYLSGGIPDGNTTLATANTDGDEVIVMKDDTGVYVKDATGRVAMVTMANFATTNGVVHIIDIVLEYRDIVGLAIADSTLSTLVSALTTADLVSALQGPGPFTVFAPTNDAFAAIQVPTNVTILSNILTYHVVPAEVLSTDLYSGLVADTLQTESITVQIDNGVFIYDSMGMTSEVTKADIRGTNGVIHIVDAVLLPGGDIVDIVSNTDSLSSLATALTDAGLISTLQGDGPFTVFAPTNDAVAAFGKSITSEVLLYHVLGAEYLSNNIPDGNTTLATANTDGDEVTIIKDDSGVYVKDAAGKIAMVTMANIAGTNGVVHIIDIVLEYRDIVDLAIADSRLSTLVSALTTADLVSALQGPGPFTVFAPTDDAFAAIQVPTNVTILSNILTYHVVEAEVLSTDLFSGLVADTLQTESITVQIDNGVFIYDSMGMVAQVTEADIEGSNGVIHIIDAVLLPGGDIVDIVSNTDSLSSLAGALTDAGLINTLRGDGPFTVFAPTNDAVAAFGKSITSEVLLYHVLGAEYLSGDIPDGNTTLATANTDGDEVIVMKDDAGVSVKDALGRVAMVTMANIAGTNGVVHIIDIVLEYRDIVDLAIADSRLSTLVSALTTADLVSALQGPGPFTVFAPTNDAFAAIEVPTNVTILSNILQYHVVPAEVLSTDLFSGLVADTLISESITVQIDNGVFIYDSMGMTSEVTEADIVGSNGVIHIVDAVLLSGGDVVDIVSNTDSLSTLAGALTDAGLISTLQGDGPFTVFAPTNDAITAFTGVIDTELLLYHVLGAEYLSANIPTGETNLATANTDGDQVTVIKNDTGVFVEDILGRIGQVTMANIAGTNGVVHIIDIVLANRESPTIVDLAAADSRLTTLVQALTDADGDLLSVLSGSGPFTVFAPTNDAFAAITVPTDTAVLSNVLQYHVLSAEVLSSALSSGLVADTIISQTITCQIDNGVFFYDSMGRASQVTEADIRAANGVIHIVDTVFLPDGTLADITSNVDSLSILDGALVENELDTVLNGAGPFTLFAPTNDAVTAFTGDIDDQVLLYHVVGAEYLSGNIPDGETELTTANTDGDMLTVIKNGTGVFVRDAIDRVATVTMANIAGTNGVAHIIDMVLSPTTLPTANPTSAPEVTVDESGVNRVSISTVFCITFYFLSFLIFV